MEVTELGTSIVDREEHSLNVESSMHEMDPDKVTDVREVQPSNALSPRVVTESGRAMEVREVQSLNA